MIHRDMLTKPRELATSVANRLDTRINAQLDAVAAIPPPSVLLSVREKIALSVPMQSSMLISFAFHALVVLVLSVPLIASEAFSPQSALDVVLVNAKTKNRPTKADALAQANLDGGGNTEEDLRATTPTPAIEQQARAEARAAQQRVKDLEQEMKSLMTQAKSVAKVLQGEVVKDAATPPTQETANDLLEKAEEIKLLQAAIEREYSDYQKRPRAKFIGARTREYRFAQYVDAWRHKIERVGNLNYPEEAKLRKIYGKLQLTVQINSNGDVVDVEINMSSGKKVLDDAAKRIVYLAAPYDRFPDSIKREFDILGITRTWIFTRDDDLKTK